MEKFIKVLFYAVFTPVIVVPIIGFACLYYGSRTLIESVGPSQSGSVILYQEAGFLDTSISMLVRDYSASGSKPIFVGYVSDISGQGTPPQRVVWSRDGTVIAALTENVWIEAYDFQTHKTIMPFGAPFGARPGQKSKTIKSLLTSRGGQGQVVLSRRRDFDRLSRHAWWWENFPTN